MNTKMQNRLDTEIRYVDEDIRRNHGDIMSLVESVRHDMDLVAERMKDNLRTPASIIGESTTPMNAVRLGRALERRQQLHDQKSALQRLVVEK